MRMAAWMIGWIFLLACSAETTAQTAPADDPPSASAERNEPETGKTLSSIPLTPPKASDGPEKEKKKEGAQSLVTIFGSLALVLGIFFLIVWALRKMSPNAMGTLPAEAFEVLGRSPLAFRQQAMMVRCGNKLLLISTGIGGTEPLAEITEPAEVERLTELCRQSRPAGATAIFRNVFRHKETRHA
jgi:flagellar biogenesis protein FliO